MTNNDSNEDRLKAGRLLREYRERYGILPKLLAPELEISRAIQCDRELGFAIIPISDISIYQDALGLSHAEAEKLAEAARIANPLIEGRNMRTRRPPKDDSQQQR